jgi:NADH-quinone oxidoreductase subunit N
MILAVSPLFTGLMPEIILAIGASLILLLGLVSRRQDTHFASTLGLVFLMIALFAAWKLKADPPEELVALNQDGLLAYARMVAYSLGILIVLANRHVPLPEERHEFFGLILFSIAGISSVAAANDLILLFLALELVSVPTYILIGLSRRSMQAQEATGKYFFLGAFAAAITLYGFSFLYGAAGTLQLVSRTAGEPSITTAFATHALAQNKLAQLGMLLVIAGLAFKLAAVPLHSYVADVYQGAAAPIAGMLGFVPKFAGFLGLIRILSLTGWAYGDSLFLMLAAMAVATMIVGNTLALMQHNVKRMLAYSSVAHSGYMLVALTAGPGTGEAFVNSPLRNGLAALLWYMAVYGVMNLGAFAALAWLRKPGEEEEDSAQTLDDLAGSARKHPWACLALSICVLGLMGFPLTGGFLGKFYIFSAAISSSADNARHMTMLVLVIIGMLNSAIAAAYYLRIVATCYLDKPAEGVFSKRDSALAATLALCSIIVVTAFVRPTILFDQSKEAVIGMQVKSPPASAMTAQRPVDQFPSRPM